MLHLIRETYSYRRKWIIEIQDPQDHGSKIPSDNLPRVSTITEQFPHLKQPKLVNILIILIRFNILIKHEFKFINNLF